MRYTLLMHYPEMTEAELGEEALAEGKAAFDRYAKALQRVGRAGVGRRAAAVVDHDDRYLDKRRAEGAGRPVRRHQGAARRHLRARRARPGCRARLGREVARPAVGLDRDPPVGDPLPTAPGRPRRDSPEESRAVDHAARASHGTLLAILAAPTRDIALAEDSLADAYERAVEVADGWHPREPRRVAADRGPQPAARRAAFGGAEGCRAARRGAGGAPAIDRRAWIRMRSPTSDSSCCSSARTRRSTPRIRTPLMLQVVLGVEADRDRGRLRGAERDDGATAGAGEAPHPGRRHPVRGARPRRHAGAAARRARGDLRRVLGRLAGLAARRCASRSPTRRATWR